MLFLTVPSMCLVPTVGKNSSPTAIFCVNNELLNEVFQTFDFTHFCIAHFGHSKINSHLRSRVFNVASTKSFHKLYCTDCILNLLIWFALV